MDVDLELQGAIIAKLKADPVVTSLVGQRIYDSIPGNATFPYVSYGSCDVNTDDAGCIVGFDIFLQLDAWSRAPGYPEVKKIGDAVRVALHDVDLSLTTNALVFLEHQQTLNMRDPDGLTSHAVIMFEAMVERQPPPRISTLVPDSYLLKEAMPTLTIVVHGYHFVSGSVVVFAGNDQATTFVSPTQLEFRLAGGEPDPADVPVAVRNPDGAISAPATFHFIAT